MFGLSGHGPLTPGDAATRAEAMTALQPVTAGNAFRHLFLWSFADDTI